MSVIKTTKKDFKLFKKECRKWIKKFGLTEWLISFKHEKLKDDREAECRSHYTAKWVYLGLSSELQDYDKSRKYIKDCALEEVIHLMLASMSELSRQRFTRESELNKAEHEIVMRIMHVLRG